MASLIVNYWWIAAAVGAILMLRGVVGRRRSGTPECRACGYGLSSVTGDACPECGADLRRERSTVCGGVRVLWGWIVLGGVLIGAAAGAGAVVRYAYRQQGGWYALAPDWLLVRVAPTRWSAQWVWFEMELRKGHLQPSARATMLERLREDRPALPTTEGAYLGDLPWLGSLVLVAGVPQATDEQWAEVCDAVIDFAPDVRWHDARRQWLRLTADLIRGSGSPVRREEVGKRVFALIPAALGAGTTEDETIAYYRIWAELARADVSRENALVCFDVAAALDPGFGAGEEWRVGLVWEVLMQQMLDRMIECGEGPKVKEWLRTRFWSSQPGAWRVRWGPTLWSLLDDHDDRAACARAMWAPGIRIVRPYIDDLQLQRLEARTRPIMRRQSPRPDARTAGWSSAVGAASFGSFPEVFAGEPLRLEVMMSRGGPGVKITPRIQDGWIESDAIDQAYGTTELAWRGWQELGTVAAPRTSGLHSILVGLRLESTGESERIIEEFEVPVWVSVIDRGVAPTFLDPSVFGLHEPLSFVVKPIGHEASLVTAVGRMGVGDEVSVTLRDADRPSCEWEFFRTQRSQGVKQDMTVVIHPAISASTRRVRVVYRRHDPTWQLVGDEWVSEPMEMTHIAE